MGEVAPPVSCQLVSSSTDECASSIELNKSDAKPIANKKYGKECHADSKYGQKECPADSDESPLGNGSNQSLKCGSYGASSSVYYGPCDTTLTPDDDIDINNNNDNDINNNNNNDGGKDGFDDFGDENDDDLFIKVESKKSKAKRAFSVEKGLNHNSSIVNKASSFHGVSSSTHNHLSHEKESLPSVVETRAKESSAPASSNHNNNGPPPSDTGSFAASFKSFSTLNVGPPSERSQPSKKPYDVVVSSRDNNAQSSFSSLPSSSSSLSTNSSKYPESYAASVSSSSISSSNASSSCKSLPLGASALTVNAWSHASSSSSHASSSSSHAYSSTPRQQETPSGIDVESSFRMSRSARPLSSLSSGEGEVNDGTESECGSVSGLSVDGYSRAESVASSSSSCHEEQPGKLFVGSLAASVTEQDLYKYFSQFGEVKSCFIKFDLGTNKSRGFGFVVFREAEVINTVMGYCSGFENVTSDGIRQTRSHVIHGRPIHVRKAKPIAEMKRIRLKDDFDESQQKRVFIGGVPLEVTEEVIQTHFCKVGPVEKVILIFGTSENENGRHRGIGFVTFAQRQHAEAAIRIRYHAIPEHFCTIECKPAIQKGDKYLPSSSEQPPPISKSSSASSSVVNLTLADFQQNEDALSNAFSSSANNHNKAGILPTPEDSSGPQQPSRSPSELAVALKRPVVEVTPPAQSWSSSSPSSSKDGNLGYNNNNSFLLQACGGDSRPPSALSVDSGYSGVRSVSPVSDGAASIEADGSATRCNAIGNADRVWSSANQRPGFCDGASNQRSGFCDGSGRGVNTLLGRGDNVRSSSGDDIWRAQYSNTMSVPSPHSSVQSSAHRAWNPNGSTNSSLALNPYGINLSLVYPEQMEKILADRFGSGSGSDSTVAAGSNDRGAAGIKYEWNHWGAASSTPVGGGGGGGGGGAPTVEDDKEAGVTLLEDLPFAPFSRLTFLRDEAVEVRGANGSNGFDVYVR